MQTDTTTPVPPWLFAGGLANELSWSKSRRGKFDDCRRAYWLHYYGAWGGWDRGANPRAKRLYMLKHLSTRASWVGNSIHAAAKRALTAELAGEFIDGGSVIDETVRIMKGELAQSKRGTYRQVKKGFGLIEHELGLTMREGRFYFEEAFEQAAAGVRALLGSSTYARATMSSSLKPIDELDGFMLDETKVYVAPDLAFVPPEDDQLLEEVDWKSGRPKAADAEQLDVYAAYAEAKWNVPAERIVGRLVYVGGGELAEPSFKVESADVLRFREQALVSIGAMRAVHGKPEEAFPKTTNTRTCEWCSFRAECWPEGKVPR